LSDLVVLRPKRHHTSTVRVNRAPWLDGRAARIVRRCWRSPGIWRSAAMADEHHDPGCTPGTTRPRRTSADTPAVPGDGQLAQLDGGGRGNIAVRLDLLQLGVDLNSPVDGVSLGIACEARSVLGAACGSGPHWPDGCAAGRHPGRGHAARLAAGPNARPGTGVDSNEGHLSAHDRAIQ
jgi:hypothetical protein